MSKEIENYWNATAQKYQKKSGISLASAHYGPYAPQEKDLKLLGNVRNKKILEIGCGGGQCSIAFARQGAKCTAIDLSEEQLKFAKELSKENKVEIDFRQGDFQDLKAFKSSSFDIVFSAYSLQYSFDLRQVFSQVYRILKKRGLFVFSFDHPFYLIIKKKTKKIKESYFQTGRMESKSSWEDKNKNKIRFVYYKNKLSDIYNALADEKFMVEKILEPLDLKGEKAWTKGEWSKFYPKELVKLVGPTIIFKARKNK